MLKSEHTEFFSKLWKCPIRRCWRYGRKFIFIIALGIFIWMSLDFLAIFVTNPRTYPPFISLIIHAFLTIVVSLILTLGSYKLYLRLGSRFRLIRVFPHPKKRSTIEDDIDHEDLNDYTTKKSSLLLRILFYTSLLGFICGIGFGYLHLRGWVPDSEQSMLIYAITLCIAVILCTYFVLHQVKQNRLKAEIVNINKRKS